MVRDSGSPSDGASAPGRPSKLTADVESRILNAIRCGAPNKVACSAAGIAEETLYGWLRRGKEEVGSDYARFASKLDQARNEGVSARLALIQKAAVKDWRAAAWLLERDLPESFSMKFKVEHSTKEPTFAEVLAQLREDRRPPKLPKEADTC